MNIRPKYITFDCYGTLTRFRMGDVARAMFADRIPAEKMEQFMTRMRGDSEWCVKPKYQHLVPIPAPAQCETL